MNRIYYRSHHLIVTLIIILSFAFNINSQKDKNIDVTNLPYYNFGKGVGLTSPDSLFQFNIRFRIQNRVSYIKNDNQDKVFDGQIRRLRLRFDGYVGSPSLIYVLQLSFAPGDVGEIQDGSNLNIIRDAVVYYKYKNHWNFGFGQTKLPGNRQRVNSSGALQLTDRSINNSRFNIDRDFGFFINYINEYKNTFSWNVKTAITTGDGRNFTDASDDGLAYTGKIELMPLGKFEKDGVYFEGDLFREKSPKVMISGAYHFNDQAKRQAGVLGDLLFDPRDMQSTFIDALLKYQGFAFLGSYMNRNTNNPITENEEGQQIIIYKGAGYDFQSSYIFNNNWEIIGRYSHIFPHESVTTHFPRQDQITFGLTKYLWEHAFKLQFEANFDKLKYYDGIIKNNLYLRFQVEMGI